MMTRELTPEEWAAFFDCFSRRFRGRRMTIEVALAADADSRTLADRLPLLGITVEPAAAPADSIQVMLGDAQVQNVVHVIGSRPASSWRRSATGRTIGSSSSRLRAR